MKVSILIGSRDRCEVLARCLRSVLAQQYHSLEVLVLDDASAQPQLFKVLKSQFQDDRLRFLRVEPSQGVAGGRNRLMAEAGGDVFCFIDDDAVFADDDCVARLVAAFEINAEIGIVAPKIIDHRPAGDYLFVPFSQYWRKRRPELVDTPGYAAYFVGTGHAIQRRVWAACGGYSHQLVYGEEEMDLSYRAIEAGFKLYYQPTAVVHHHPQPSVVAKAAKQNHPEMYHHLRNRFFIARKYLPWPYLPVYLATWLIQHGREAVTQGATPEYLQGVWAGLASFRQVERTPLSPPAVAYIRRHFGRLWY
jgi:GT2 family glycosyltransferase